MPIPFCPGLGLTLSLFLPHGPAGATSNEAVELSGFGELPAELEFTARSVGTQESPAAPPQGSASPPAEKPPESRPWRLNSALGLPDWLTISGTQRTRYEGLDGQFRSTLLNLNENQQILVLRTTLFVGVKVSPFGAAVELIDSRQFLAEENDFLNTTVVDTLDFLQLYANFEQDDLFASGDAGGLLIGRYTMDIGSRRFVARNRFRNTINSFNGVNATYSTDSGADFQGFWTLPTDRVPKQRDDLIDNDPALDDQSTSTQFFGLYASQEDLLPAVNGEVYYFYLDEEDSPDLPTADREISTTGFRVYRPQKPGHLDFEVESTVQFGTSRSNVLPGNTTDLDHLAYFQHLSVGYVFDAPWQPHVELLFDYASGDSDPTDDENNRFDTLYGARRWELGPTGIFGALARSNLVSPGWRLTGNPSERTEFMVANRFNYLAAEKDAWVPAGIADPTGGSGRYIGTLFEGRLRWNVVPKNIALEIGAAYLLAGTFMKEAPNSPGEDSLYGYAQATFTF